MGLTPRQRMTNFRQRLAENPERYEKYKLKDKERQRKTRLSWSKQKRKLEYRKNAERNHKYRLSLSFAKELKNDINNSFTQNKTPEEILQLLKTDRGVFDLTTNAFSSTPVRTPMLISDVKTPHTLKRNKGIFNSTSKAITSTPARTPKFLCSIKKKRASKANKSTPARTPFSALRAIKSTPARTPLSASKGIKSTPARTPLSASKGIKSTPARTLLLTSKGFKSTPLRTPLTASKAIKSTPVRTPLSSTKKTLNEKNKQTPLLISEKVREKKALEEKIEQFFVEHTWLCRRDRRLKITPRVLMIPMTHLYKAFCDENPDLCVSITKFNNLKPPKLQVVKKVNFNAFLSIYGGSSKTVISEILKVCVDLPEQLRNLMCLNICDQNKNTCKSGACKKCPFHKKISSTNEMEDKIHLRDEKSTLSGTQSKMNIIEKFVIGAFTPPPDLNPLQFHEVSRVLQTRLQESKKNIHIVKIIQGANKSPKLQIQVEKKFRKQSEGCKENQHEIEVPKIDNNGKNKIVPKTAINPKTNKDVKESRVGKTESPIVTSLKNSSKKCESPRDEKSDKELLNQRKSRKSIENENIKSISSSINKGSNTEKNDLGKTKMDKNTPSLKNKNSKTTKTNKECVQIQANTDEKVKKGMKKQNTNNQDNPIDETNIKANDKRIKSIAKENEEDEKLTKKTTRSRSRTNEKTETNKNSKTKKTNNECVQIQANTDGKAKKGMKKQNTNNQDNSIDETNIKAKDRGNKSIEKVNEEDEKFTKKTKQSRSRTNKKTETNVKSKQTEILEDDSSKLQEKGTRKSKNKGKNICHSFENSDKDNRNEMCKSAQNQIDNENNDTTSEVSSTPDQTFHEYDESFSLHGKKKNSKPKPRIPLNPVEHKIKERHQSKITTFLSVENSQINKSGNNASNKSEIETHLQNLVQSTIEKVIEKYKHDKKGLSDNNVVQNSKQNEPENVNVSEKNIKDRLKKLKKVRRSIVNALNESALSELDTSVICEVNEEKKDSSRKRKSSVSSPISNNEDTSKTPVDKKRRTELKIIESDKAQKEAESKNAVKNKHSNSKKNKDVKEETGSIENNHIISANAKKAKSGNKNAKNEDNTKTVAVGKAKKSITNKQLNNQEKNKPAENNLAASENVLVDSNIEENDKQKDKKNKAFRKKLMDGEKLKKMKKVRRSIVGQLNESALSDLESDLIDEVDKENKVGDKEIQSSKINAKPNKEEKSKKTIDKKKETISIQLEDKKTKKNTKPKTEPKTKRTAKPKETKSTKKPVMKDVAKPQESNNRAAAEAKARELLMPEDCPITANLGTMKYLEQRSTLLTAIDNQRESDGDIFKSNIFKRKSGVSNLLDSDNIDDTFAIRTPNCKGTAETHDGTSPFTPRTGMFADWADLANVSTHKTPTVKTVPTPGVTVDTEHKKVVMQVTYHMQKNKRRGIRKLQTNDENDEKVAPKSRKKNNSLLDLPNMTEDGIDDLDDDYFD